MAYNNSISRILNSMAIQVGRQEENLEKSKNNVDTQFNDILEKITGHFNNNEMKIVLNWLNESIQKEMDLEKKIELNPFVYKKDSILILKQKVNLLHSKIIELLLNKIDIVTSSGDSNEMREVFSAVQMFLVSMNLNKHVSEKIYGDYLKKLTQTMKMYVEIAL